MKTNEIFLSKPLPTLRSLAFVLLTLAMLASFWASSRAEPPDEPPTSDTVEFQTLHEASAVAKWSPTHEPDGATFLPVGENRYRLQGTLTQQAFIERESGPEPVYNHVSELEFTVAEDGSIQDALVEGYYDPSNGNPEFQRPLVEVTGTFDSRSLDLLFSTQVGTTSRYRAAGPVADVCTDAHDAAQECAYKAECILYLLMGDRAGWQACTADCVDEPPAPSEPCKTCALDFTYCATIDGCWNECAQGSTPWSNGACVYCLENNDSTCLEDLDACMPAP